LPPARRFAAVLAAATLNACAVNPAPRGWLPRAEELPQETRGAWIAVRGKNLLVEGELIAVSEERVQVLTRFRLEDVPLAQVRGATVALYDPPNVAGGALIVLTHGYWAVFTLPLWLGLAAGASREPLLEVSGAELPAVARYARFPQGLPPGVGAAGLGPLSAHRREPPRGGGKASR
jgi:hypothetical protein